MNTDRSAESDRPTECQVCRWDLARTGLLYGRCPYCGALIDGPNAPPYAIREKPLTAEEYDALVVRDPQQFDGGES